MQLKSLQALRQNEMHPFTIKRTKKSLILYSSKTAFMKKIRLVLFCSCFILTAMAQNKTAKLKKPDPNKKTMIVEASCGECQLGLKGKSCDLAVRIDGKAYFVDGTKIDDYGDAHAKEGFCEAISKAEVQGKIVNNRFKATYFKLLPQAEDATPKKL